MFGEARGLVVTYSTQFRSLSSSAGIGSHRGAVQPLHRGGSDCRGSQRDDFRAAYLKGEKAGTPPTLVLGRVTSWAELRTQRRVLAFEWINSLPLTSQDREHAAQRWQNVGVDRKERWPSGRHVSDTRDTCRLAEGTFPGVSFKIRLTLGTLWGCFFFKHFGSVNCWT